MQVLILRPYRKDNIYFRTLEEREKIKENMFSLAFKSIACKPSYLYSASGHRINLQSDLRLLVRKDLPIAIAISHHCNMHSA